VRPLFLDGKGTACHRPQRRITYNQQPTGDDDVVVREEEVRRGSSGTVPDPGDGELVQEGVRPQTT